MKEKQESLAGEEEITCDDLGCPYIPYPKVGTETKPFKVVKFVKTKVCIRIDNRGCEFSMALRSKTSKEMLGYKLITDKNEEFWIRSWELFQKLKDIFLAHGDSMGAPNITIVIKHLTDGMRDPEALKEKRCWEVKIVKDAIKEESTAKKLPIQSVILTKGETNGNKQ